MCKLAVMCLDGKEADIKAGFDLELEGYNSLNVDGTDISGNAVLVINKDNMSDYQF